MTEPENEKKSPLLRSRLSNPRQRSLGALVGLRFVFTGTRGKQ